MEQITSPRGTRDIYGDQAYAWSYLASVARDIFYRYGYSEIITPSFESTRLFVRGIGESTDIVTKEMYSFKDKAERDLTLRPEVTASVVRAYIQHHMASLPQPVKLFYIGQMYRYERPQAGRYREFTQIGIEAVGSDDPAVDAETIQMLVEYLKLARVDQFDTYINTMGCSDDRTAYMEKLRKFVAEKNVKLCKECVKRSAVNILRVFDCKEPECKSILQSAPKITDNVCKDCKTHFMAVCSLLDKCGINYTIDKMLVRGFDYYTRTTYEMKVKSLGAQDAIAGGGRYDKLVEQFGGQPTPAVGFAIGLDRLYLAIKDKPRQKPVDLYIARFSDEQKSYVFNLATRLRKSGINCEMDYMGRSLKSQLKHASKLEARYAVVIGPDELKSGECRLKKMETGKEKTVKISDIASELSDTVK